MVPLCVIGAFFVWIVIRSRLAQKVGPRAVATFLCCMAGGVALGIWIDFDLYADIVHRLSNHWSRFSAR